MSQHLDLCHHSHVRLGDFRVLRRDREDQEEGAKRETQEKHGSARPVWGRTAHSITPSVQQTAPATQVYSAKKWGKGDPTAAPAVSDERAFPSLGGEKKPTESKSTGGRQKGSFRGVATTNAFDVLDGESDA